MHRLIALALLILVMFQPARAAEPEVKAEDLPRVKPTEPADVLKTFKVRPGFHIELVAAEPLVIDPICMCFDENGRLFVIEMRDYSERRAEKLSRVRMLEDTDGDGKFDKSTIFLDHLPWATAIFYCNGGVMVGACPDIIFARDTNGDGVADDVKRLFTGFGSTQDKLNVQGLFNNFIWGLDNRIHGCSGHDGGMIESVPRKGEPLDVRNKGFVINPRDWSMTLENGGGQYGLSYNQFGQLFTCTNSSHCETFMYDGKYAARNPNYTMPDPRISIAADGPAAEVFRTSPEEPWRVIRTRWRIAGLVGGPVEGGGRSAGYFTGATGITVYRGNAFGPDYVGDSFTGDAGGNLVHHDHIKRNGIELVADRPKDENNIEFCASSDNWFRPVDFANAPDGTLYIADMYRETIEHPWSIPPNIKKFLDLNSGNDRGRIYRLVPDGFKQPKLPKLGSASIEELVATLDHPNGWHRDTAARLLFEKQDRSAVPLLKKLLATASPVGRIHALHALQGLAALDD
ncbi:MAG TPA: PVC-type heme-binding CxxCH protein, partial [Tepidisphaeraceae bacterium]|nr:PVC-type heme-binding CxxCH protein [Tepidisphaeraceae bacterium]